LGIGWYLVWLGDAQGVSAVADDALGYLWHSEAAAWGRRAFTCKLRQPAATFRTTGGPVMARLKTHLANTALVLVSVLLTYYAVEFIFFRLLLPNMPLQLRPHLPDVADVLVQNSKSGFVPHHYIALLGDSYAEGIGDWLWQTGGNQARPYHSGNVIHDLTGRDVVSFGKGGAGSAEGIVERPAGVFSGNSCYLFPSIEPPSQMFIYYYEGNDVEDNLFFEYKVSSRYGHLDTQTMDRYLNEQYAKGNPWDCHMELLDTTTRMVKFLYQYYFSGADIPTCAPGPNGWHGNGLVVAGQTVPAPPLQGPALGIDHESIRAAMAVLDRSLNWLRHRFADVPITVVYIPSPLSVYHFVGEDVSYCNVGLIPADRVDPNSNLISDLVEKSATSQGLAFLDARPTMRALAATTVIHGPRDWAHFNEAGYRALGALVAAHVTMRP